MADARVCNLIDDFYFDLISVSSTPVGGTVTFDPTSEFINRAEMTFKSTTNASLDHTFTNKGFITTQAGAVMINNQTVNNYSDGIIVNNGSITNNGLMSNAATSTMINTDTMSNDGQLDNYGTMTSTGTLINDGTMSVFGGMVDATSITNNGTFNFTGGILSVDTFNGDLNNTGGTLGPGNSPGTTNITGDYSQDATSTLLIEIEGLLAGTEYDVLNVGGTATLDGILEFDVDYSGLLLGDSFNILNADVISGTFASITDRRINLDWVWELDYNLDPSGTDVLTATVTAIPIPASVWLFGSGLGFLGWFRKRALKN